MLNLAETEQTTLIPGCRSHDLCGNRKCKNGGLCQDMWTTSYCECQPGYIGDVKTLRGNRTNLKRQKFLPFSVILKRSDSLLEYYFYISYVKLLVFELEKGRSGTVLGDNFSHVSLQDVLQIFKV